MYPYAIEPKAVGPIEVTRALRKLPEKRGTIRQIVETIREMYGNGEWWDVPIPQVKSSLEKLAMFDHIEKDGKYYRLKSDIFDTLKKLEKKYRINLFVNLKEE